MNSAFQITFYTFMEIVVSTRHSHMIETLTTSSFENTTSAHEILSFYINIKLEGKIIVFQFEEFRESISTHFVLLIFKV